MKVRVLLFAAGRELAGAAEVEIDLASGATVAELRRALARRVPALEPLLAHSRFAVDADFVTDDTPLAPADEVACIPPVSGG
jgi:molybdopterin converting factor subunit 1